jgi:hypothetical protein
MANLLVFLSHKSFWWSKNKGNLKDEKMNIQVVMN